MSDLRTIAVSVGPQVWRVTYAADELDLASALDGWNRAMALLLAGDEAAAVEGFADLLYALVRGWDVRDVEGQPYPLQRAALLPLGPAVLAEITRQVTGDMAAQRPPPLTYPELLAEVEAREQGSCDRGKVNA